MRCSADVGVLISKDNDGFHVANHVSSSSGILDRVCKMPEPCLLMLAPFAYFLCFSQIAVIVNQDNDG